MIIIYIVVYLFFYNSQNQHSIIRAKVFEYIINNKENFYIYFQENEENKDSLENLLNNVLEIIKPFKTKQSKF